MPEKVGALEVGVGHTGDLCRDCNVKASGCAYEIYNLNL